MECGACCVLRVRSKMPENVLAPGGSPVLSDRLQALERVAASRGLCRREIQIVVAGARGLQTKATAAELGLSPKTVDELWRRVYRKIDCSSRLEVLAHLFSARTLETSL